MTATRMLYDINETGQALSVGRTMVYKLIESGDLPTVKIGRRCLIPADGIENYIERLRASDQARSA